MFDTKWQTGHYYLVPRRWIYIENVYKDNYVVHSFEFSRIDRVGGNKIQFKTRFQTLKIKININSLT